VLGAFKDEALRVALRAILTASARAGVSIEWVATKKRTAQVEQRN